MKKQLKCSFDDIFSTMNFRIIGTKKWIFDSFHTTQLMQRVLIYDNRNSLSKFEQKGNGIYGLVDNIIQFSNISQFYTCRHNINRISDF